MLTSYSHTVKACYIGYITQAINNTFITLLFVTFHETLGLPLAQISLLIFVNFCTQIAVDFLSSFFVDAIGYRASALIAHGCSAFGLVLLSILPFVMDGFPALIICVVLYAIGGGLTEVIISPIVEACPGDEKEKAMSLLHSFYCWGCVLVVTVSTLLFKLIGIGNWRYVSLIWAVVPLFNIFYFSAVPINVLVQKEERMSMKDLSTTPVFWILLLMMMASGASEQAMSQWASAFAEEGLHVDKTVGDLLGPCLFSVFMGLSRVFHSKVGTKVSMKLYLVLSALLCIAGYLIAVLSPAPLLSLAGCSITGFAVGAMWPGSFSTASASCPKGGTVMFALLALAGDLGCAGGPLVTGLVSSSLGDDLKKGLASGIVFPVLLILGILLLAKATSGKKQKA